MLDRTTLNIPAETWTDDRVAMLRRLWADGLSASQIAGQLGGISRNAAIGKLHRLGLTGLEQGANLPRQPRVTKRRSPRRATTASPTSALIRAAQAARLRLQDGSLEPLVIIESPKPPEFLGIAFMDLKPDHCRWPRGEGADITFCGQKQEEGQSYCSACCRIAYQVPQSRRDNSPAPARHGASPPATQLKEFGA